MYSILNLHPPTELLKLPNITNIVQGMLPYSKRFDKMLNFAIKKVYKMFTLLSFRHFERLTKARQDVSLLNFSYSQMRLN